MLKKISWIGFITLLLAIIPLSAQDMVVTMRTFVNPVFAVQGLRPQSWGESTRYSGVYTPSSDESERTTLVIQAGETTVAKVLASLVSLYQLDAPPARIARIRTDTLSWSVYKIERTSGSETLLVDIAVAENGGRLFIVLMQTDEAHYEQLHEVVFLAVLDSLAPVEAVANDGADMGVGERETEILPTATAEVTPEITPEITAEATAESTDEP